jgi:hypothetical protein
MKGKNPAPGEFRTLLIRRSTNIWHQREHVSIMYDYLYLEGTFRMKRFETKGAINASNTMCGMSGMIDRTPGSGGSAGYYYKEKRKEGDSR